MKHKIQEVECVCITFPYTYCNRRSAR